MSSPEEIRLLSLERLHERLSDRVGRIDAPGLGSIVQLQQSLFGLGWGLGDDASTLTPPTTTALIGAGCWSDPVSMVLHATGHPLAGPFVMLFDGIDTWRACTVVTTTPSGPSTCTAVTAALNWAFWCNTGSFQLDCFVNTTGTAPHFCPIASSCGSPATGVHNFFGNFIGAAGPPFSINFTNAWAQICGTHTMNLHE